MSSNRSPYRQDTLCNVLLQVGLASLKQLLLEWCNFADLVYLFHPVWTKLDLRSEEVDTFTLEQGAVDKRRLDNALLTLSSLEQALGETRTSHCH